MKKIFLLFILVLFTFLLFFPKRKKDLFSDNQNKFSYHIGWSFHEEIKPLCLNVEEVIKGIKDANGGRQEKPVDVQQLRTWMLHAIDQVRKKREKENLEAAENYLAKISQSKEMIELEPQKLYICTLEEGDGDSIFDLDRASFHFTIFAFYEGTFKEIYSTYSHEPVLVPLEEAIGGFVKGVQGMRKREKRRIVIHPSLSFGPTRRIEPNLLLMYEVTLCDLEN